MTGVKRIGVLAIVLFASLGAGPREALSRARQLYNLQQYDAAIDAAGEARGSPGLADVAALVWARAHLERFRRTDDAADLSAAREGLVEIHQALLLPDDRVELMIGLGELLYFDNRAGAAAEQFEIALARVDQGNQNRKERVLDWWASALDRQAQLGAGADQQPLYTRIVSRMEEELRRDAESAVASYWLVAGARGNGDLERAWDAALAGWVRAPLAGDRAAALRADLDRIVRQAIIPERARQTSSPGDVQQTMAVMLGEWEALKQTWTDR